MNGDTGIRAIIFRLVNASDDSSRYILYDYLMIILIALSMIPVMFKESNELLQVIDGVTAAAFIIDYILRWLTADYYFDDHRAFSFIKYPFSFMAIIDLLSILPSLTSLHPGFKILRILMMLRIAGVFKAIRYSKSLAIISAVFRKSRDSLIAVCMLVVVYIFVCALLIFSTEPDSFDNFFEALYWAVISLTTVGYGDIYPVSTAGRVIAMISAVVGIAVIALPSGILTAGYIRVIEEQKDPQINDK